MEPETTEVPFKNTVKDVLRAYKIINKHSKTGKDKKTIIIFFRIWILILTAYSSVFCFKEYNFLRKDFFLPLSETIGWAIAGTFLGTVFVLGVFYYTVLKNYKIKRHYKKEPYNKCTRLLTVSEGGITLSTACSSRYYKWDKVKMLIEGPEGIVVLFEGSHVFIPSRYISAETVTGLREHFKNHIPIERISFISRVMVTQNPEICEPFKVIDLIGEPIKQITVDAFSFDDYLFMRLGSLLYFNPDIYVITVIALMFMLCLTVFTAKNIFVGLISFTAFSALLLTVILTVIYFNLRRSYKLSENCSHRITFYGNAIYIETANSFSVLEYKNILSYSEKAYSIVILGHDIVFRISRENADELEKIKELIKRKTINNKQQINLN